MRFSLKVYYSIYSEGIVVCRFIGSCKHVSNRFETGNIISQLVMVSISQMWLHYVVLYYVQRTLDRQEIKPHILSLSLAHSSLLASHLYRLPNIGIAFKHKLQQHYALLHDIS